jgi:putative membrane protein
MVDYHKGSMERLSAIALRHQLTPPDELDPVSEKWHARLTRASGPQVDGGYMGGQAIYLYTARYAYKRERLRGRDPALRRDAASQAAAIDEHRRELRELMRPAKPNPAELHAEDRTFLLFALDVDNTQMQLNRLAAEKASDERVKELARNLLAYHEASHARLAETARQNGLEPSPSLSPLAQQMQAQLQGMTGAAFDWEYVTNQVINYYWAFYRYEREAIRGHNEPLKALAGQTVQDVQRHHDAALAIVRQGPQASQARPSRPSA